MVTLYTKITDIDFVDVAEKWLVSFFNTVYLRLAGDPLIWILIWPTIMVVLFVFVSDMLVNFFYFSTDD